MEQNNQPPEAETTIVQDVADLFRACGFEVREEADHQFAVSGSLTSAGLLVEAVLERQPAAPAVDAAKLDEDEQISLMAKVKNYMQAVDLRRLLLLHEKCETEEAEIFANINALIAKRVPNALPVDAAKLDDLGKLKALAEAATPGPWERGLRRADAANRAPVARQPQAAPLYQVNQHGWTSMWCDVSKAEFDASEGVKRVLFAAPEATAPKPLDVSEITSVVRNYRANHDSSQHEVIVKFGRSKEAADEFLRQFGDIVLGKSTALEATSEQMGGAQVAKSEPSMRTALRGFVFAMDDTRKCLDTDDAELRRVAVKRIEQAEAVALAALAAPTTESAAAPADEPDHGETVLRVQEALGITTTGWVSPDVILLRLAKLATDRAAEGEATARKPLADARIAGLEQALDICQDVIREADNNSECAEEMGATRCHAAIETAIRGITGGGK